MTPERLAIGLVVGNRGFFPGHLVETGRRDMLSALERAGFEVVALSPEETRYGAVESFAEAQRCAELFRRHEARVAGVVVTLPNFGDERAIADALRLSGLKVPVLVQATPDAPAAMGISHRRDSFCGKMSACNNLRQYGIPYSLTRQHTLAPEAPAFAADLAQFAATCRVVRGLRGLRVGSIGARPQAFNTVRYSEKILEAHGISVITLDLSEVLGRIARLGDDAAAVRAKLAAIRAYTSTDGTPEPALLKMAKLGAVLDAWMQEAAVGVSAIQCWTSLEENLGVVPCTLMSMMSDGLLSSACEVDVCGVIAMHALRCASGSPSALLDWNNNYGAEADKAVCFHCSNLPKHFFRSTKMDFQAIIAGTVGRENTFGTVVGRVKSGAMTFLRLSTDDASGALRGYVGEGRFTDDPLETFGGAGVVEIPQLEALLRFICQEGFEHHVAANFSTAAAAIADAARYLGWKLHRHPASPQAGAEGGGR